MSKDVTNEVFGRTTKTMVPSGRVFIIREQNGNDDDVLSNSVTVNDLTNIDNFLTGIIIGEEIDGNQVPVTFKQVTELLNNDRYFLLIKSRVFSLGDNITFTYDWGEGTGKITYTEDLSQYLHDYTKPFPEVGEPGYFENKIPPYIANSDIYSRHTLLTSSNREVRFGLMTRQGEKWTMALPNDLITRNTELRARGIELKTADGNWVKIENFNMFTKKEMIEIKKAVHEVDPPYSFTTQIENPKTGQILNYPIMAGQDFFYPVEI